MSQTKLLTQHKILQFQRTGIPAQKLYNVIKQATSDPDVQIALLEAVLVYVGDLRQLRSKRGPMGMNANQQRKPQPFVTVGQQRTRVMLPRLLYRPLGRLINRFMK